MEEEEEEGGAPKVPDAHEFRLLLAQDFGEHVEWAMNWFFRKRKCGRSRTEMGFSQAVITPILLPNEGLKIGIEMLYKNLTVKGLNTAAVSAVAEVEKPQPGGAGCGTLLF